MLLNSPVSGSAITKYVSIQSSGKPIEHFLADDQFLSLHFICKCMYICIRIKPSAILTGRLQSNAEVCLEAVDLVSDPLNSVVKKKLPFDKFLTLCFSVFV